MAEQQRSLTAELQELVLVALGAVPGALVRWQVALHWADRHLLVNVAGAALLGYLAGLPAAPRRQLLVGIGFCGSLTTFSSWMLDAMCFSSMMDIGDQPLGCLESRLALAWERLRLGFWAAQRWSAFLIR